MTLAYGIAGLILLGAMALALLSMARTQSVALRLVGLELLLTLVISGVAIQAAATLQDSYLDILLAAAGLSFVATITVGRWLQTRGD
jgi:multisubunit Na+/H+ antiporter MnhF subunit